MPLKSICLHLFSATKVKQCMRTSARIVMSLIMQDNQQPYYNQTLIIKNKTNFYALYLLNNTFFPIIYYYSDDGARENEVDEYYGPRSRKK